jgi:type 1 glutamine amidotransferase
VGTLAEMVNHFVAQNISEKNMNARSGEMNRRGDMNRRDVLRAAGVVAAGMAAGAFPLGWVRGADDGKRQHVLFFTKSAGFQHSVITRKNPEELAYAEQILTDLGKKHGFDVTATKDGTAFTPEGLAKFDAIVFYTTGDLTTAGTDKTPPMPRNGRETLIKYVESGKGMLGLHCASDTFHSKPNEVDPYIALLGGEFIHHGAQQTCDIKIIDHNFGPIKNLQDFNLKEEWYQLKNFAPDMHVIAMQQTQSMDAEYQKLKPYPMTWARKQAKGRVFYSSLGHREDVWKNPIFENILLGGLAWAMGNAEAEVTPNFKEAAPEVQNLARPADAGAL